MVLKHFDQFFTLHFALLAYTDPVHNRYRYRMEGFENWWRPGNNNFARYTALPPGHYVFRVQAADHNGKLEPHGNHPARGGQTGLVPVLVGLGLDGLLAFGLGFALYRQRMQQVRLASKAQFLFVDQHGHFDE